VTYNSDVQLIYMSEPIETFPLETLERAESLQLEADSAPDQWSDRSNQRAHEPMTELAQALEQFVQHERREIELLAGLGAALETHRKAMTELAGAMRLLRENLFLQEDQ